MSVQLFFCFILFVCLGIYIYQLTKLDKPKYLNKFPNSGKPFTEEMVKRFEKMRKENNPSNIQVGVGTGRCQFCGSKNIDKKWQRTDNPMIQIKKCNCCNLEIDRY